jgi:flagellar biosynthesis/type III secretory pathway chaperone
MTNLFNGCSVKTGQYISEKRQHKKNLMKKLGITGKRLRKLQHRARLSGDKEAMIKYGIIS